MDFLVKTSDNIKGQVPGEKFLMFFYEIIVLWE